MMSHQIPAEMKALPHWVASSHDKIPVDAKTGRRASPTDPATWAPFTQAETFAEHRSLDIGFALTIEAGITCIDLDGCRVPKTGTVEPWAQRIVEAIDSYTEVSRSGTGLHVYARGTLPPGRRRSGRIEMYESGRYVIVTGDPLPGYDVIAERSDALAQLHRATFPTPVKATPATVSGGALHLGDAAILATARQSERFRRLYDGGDLSDYGNDWSSADLGELDHLVRAGAVADQLDRLHRNGALMRDKWDSRRGDSTYGAQTIARALDGQVRQSRQQPTAPRSGDPCIDVRDDLALLRTENARLTRELDTAIADRDSSRRRARDAEELLNVLRNSKLGAQRAAAAGLVEVFRTAAPAPVEKRPAGLTNKEACYRVPLAMLAEITGLSPDALSRQTATLAGYTTPDGAPILHREIATIPGHVDRDTGEITSAHKELWIGPGTDPTAFGALLATLDPTERKAWGGDRDHCPDHPTAGTIRRARRVERTRVECTDCGRLLRVESRDLPGERVTTVAPSPIPQDAWLAPEVAGDRRQDGVAEIPNAMPHLAPTPMRDCGTELYRNMRYSDSTPESAVRIAAARADLLARRADELPLQEDDTVAWRNGVAPIDGCRRTGDA